jgi:HK97 gp10 family phage protein
MSGFRAKVVGTQKLEAALVRKAKRYEQATSAGLSAWALLVRNEAVKSVQKGPRSGRVYRSGTVTHQASAPGQAPATDTGNLAGSIGWNIEASTLTADVFASARYAVHLELGTRHIKPRPFLVPALDETADKGLAVFKATLARAA